MKVYIPTHLRSYTGQESQVAVRGKTISEAMKDLNAQFPGIRFRIIDEQDQVREHIRIFLNQEQISSLEMRVSDNDEIHIIAALSGG
ncbi:MAG: MoaD/ThiS family protein [Candidatus Heimdallarchaeota archaeon]